MSADLDLRLLAERCGERRERALEAQILERLGPQPARDAADLLRAVTCGLAQLVELIAELVGDRGGQTLDLKHHAGQRLADLVVELARDPTPLALLHEQRATCTVAPLELQPVEHLVEGPSKPGDHGTALDRHALTGRERIVPAHRVGKMVERMEGAPQEHGVDGQHQQQSDEQHDQLGRMRRHRYGHGREDEPDERQYEYGYIRAEDLPEQRQRGQAREHALKRRTRTAQLQRGDAGNVVAVPGGHAALAALPDRESFAARDPLVTSSTRSSRTRPLGSATWAKSPAWTPTRALPTGDASDTSRGGESAARRP